MALKKIKTKKTATQNQILTSESFLESFRQSSVYIQKFSGKTFVIHLSALLWQSKELEDFWQDIILCNSLGISLVLVIGNNELIESQAQQWHISNGEKYKVTKQSALKAIKESIANLQQQVQTELELALINNSQQLKSNQSPTLVYGNWLRAEPVGVIDGVDLELTGRVSNVQKAAIRVNLQNNHIVLVSPIGLGISGELFALDSQMVSIELAKQLKADKLIMFMSDKMLDSLPDEILKHNLSELKCDEQLHYWLEQSSKILHKVPKVHFLSAQKPTQLLQELFTKQGCGVMLRHSFYDEMSKATNEDIPAILELITPYTSTGELTHKPREFLEEHIANFFLVKQNGILLGCAGIITYANGKAELFALAVHTNYRKLGIGSDLLKNIIKHAKSIKVKTIFALTTQASHWFLGHKFYKKEVKDLPSAKLSSLTSSRNSHVYMLDI